MIIIILLNRQNSDNYAYFCKIWESNVSDNSKHWGQCNRCVENFDHHWKWLNNWVGEINYKLFISLCIAVIIFQIFFWSVILYAILEYFINKDKLSGSIEDFYGVDLSKEFFIISFVLFIANLIPLFVLWNLLIFHIWLYKNNLSTFEYIMDKREKEAKKVENKIKNLEVGIQMEEEKCSNEHLDSERSHKESTREKKRTPFDQKTKGSMLEYNDETSKGSLFANKQRKTEQENWKENGIFSSVEDNKSDESPKNEAELGFRVTADSMWKNKEHVHNNIDTYLNSAIENQETSNGDNKNPKITNTKRMLEKSFLRAKTTDLHIIDDVSESKELSQRAFETFSNSKNIHSNKQMVILKKSNKKDIIVGSAEDCIIGRNEHNASGILKSWSENISNILEATFKDEDEKEVEENGYKNKTESQENHYFPTKRPR